MALTDAQKTSLFEIAGIIYNTVADAANLHDSMGEVLEITGINDLKTSVTTHITNLDAAAETKVAAIITAWDALGFRTARIEGGAVGDISGVSEDPREQRQLLQERLELYIPVLALSRAIVRRHMAISAGSSSIGFMR